MENFDAQRYSLDRRRPSVSSIASDDTVRLEDILKAGPPSSADDFSPSRERSKPRLARAARLALKIIPFAFPASSHGSSSNSSSLSSSSVSVDNLSVSSKATASASSLADDTPAEDIEEWEVTLRGIERASRSAQRIRTTSACHSPAPTYSLRPTKSVAPLPQEPASSREFSSAVSPRSRKLSSVPSRIIPDAPFSPPSSSLPMSPIPPMSPPTSPVPRLYSPISRATTPITQDVDASISRPARPENELGARSIDRPSEVLSRPSSPGDEIMSPSSPSPFQSQSVSSSLSPYPSRAVSPIAVDSGPTSPFRRDLPTQTLVGLAIDVVHETEAFGDFSDEE